MQTSMNNLDLPPVRRLRVVCDSPLYSVHLFPPPTGIQVKLAWRGLGDLRHVSSSLRMRKLSEAVEETLERSKMGADGAEHPQLSALLRGLTSRVSEEPTPPLRHRFLWLLDQQLASDALQVHARSLAHLRPCNNGPVW